MVADLRSLIRPVAPPRIIDDTYTDDQFQRLVNVMRTEGPWELILAQHFGSPEEVMFTTTRSVPEGVELTWDMFLTPYFSGCLAKNGVCLFPEIEDCFLNLPFLDMARSFWKADYAKAAHMLFNINGPAANNDPAHLDGTEFRGIDLQNAPAWLLNTMAKSGLFRSWQLKKAQVIAWFYRGAIGGGFTYWPDGPAALPQRIAAPMWNKGVVAENEMMYHRAEANGPVDQRMPKGLAFNSLLQADPAVPDGWQITSDGEVIQAIPAQEARILVHWGAELYIDLTELKQVLDHTDDLTHDHVFDLFISDLCARGHSFEVPTDPMHDREFIGLLTRAYDTGPPSIYPAEAQGPEQRAA